MRNLIGIHALVWTGDWQPESARAAIKKTAEIGFDLIEIPLLDPSQIDTVWTRGALAEFEIAATCSLGLAFDTDISNGDSDVVTAGERLLDDALTAANGLGAKYLGGVIYSAMGKYTLPPSSAGRDNAVGVLRRLAARAADLGIVVGLEAVNRYETNLLNTTADAVSLIEDVGATNMVVHYDSYHANIEEGSHRRAITAAQPHLGYVHIGESHRGYLGQGTVDFPSIFEALSVASYGGPIVFESFSSRVVAPEFVGALGIWRDMWDDGVDLATHAIEFIRSQLAAYPPQD